MEKDKKDMIVDDFDILQLEAIESIKRGDYIDNVTLDSFKPKNYLNPVFFTDEKLNERVLEKLKKISEDFYKELNIPSDIKLTDIIFTGSLANYNWSQYSDVDLHLVLDFKKYKKDTEFIKNLLDGQRHLWNNKYDIEIYGFPVEIYVQDVDDKLTASGVYSISQNKWLKRPNKENVEIDKNELASKSKWYINKLRDINNSINSKDYIIANKKIEDLLKKLKKFRQSGLDKDGEYSMENLTYKLLRRIGFLDRLRNLKDEVYGKKMSLSENYKIQILNNLKKVNNHY